MTNKKFLVAILCVLNVLLLAWCTFNSWAKILDNDTTSTNNWNTIEAINDEKDWEENEEIKDLENTNSTEESDIIDERDTIETEDRDEIEWTDETDTSTNIESENIESKDNWKKTDTEKWKKSKEKETTKNTESTDTNNETKEHNIKEKKTYDYESKLYRFTVKVPFTWTFVEEKYWFTVLFYTPDDDEISENLWISIQTPQTAANLEEYYKDSMQKISEISEWFKKIGAKKIEVNGLKWISAVYETKQNGTNVKSQQTVIIDDKNHVYVLQYTATKDTYDKYINDVNNIIRSFKILD